MSEKETGGSKQENKLRQYGITTALYVAAVLLCAFYEEAFSKETAQEVVGALSDAFVIPGILFAGIGGLTWIASDGMFDMFGYAFRNFSIHHLFPSRPKEKYETFYDYRMAKEKKGRAWLKHVLLVGLGGLAVSAVLLGIYFLMG